MSNQVNRTDARCNNSKGGCNAILFEVNKQPMLAVFVDGQLSAFMAVPAAK